MDPVSTMVAGYATDKLVEIAESSFRTHVVERWSRRRARQFFEAFCDAVSSPDTTEVELQHQLDELLSDELASEILFDAYRAVCLTKSKTLGPRVIALLTAELVTAHKEADDCELAILAACEGLTDVEFSDFADFAIDHFERATEEDKKDCSLAKNGALSIQMGEETFSSFWHNDYEVSVAPMDLIECVGSWAPKLKRHGLLSDDVKERNYEYRDEHCVPEEATAREVSWWLFMAAETLRFAKLVRKAS